MKHHSNFDSASFKNQSKNKGLGGFFFPSRLGILEARLGVLDARLGVLEARLGVLEARLGVLEA